MVLYGAASHALRIRLVGVYRGREGELLLGEFRPVQSRWISLIRAVHFAYVGLVADATRGQAAPAGLGEGEGDGAENSPLVGISLGGGGGGAAAFPGGGEVVDPQDGPSDLTRRLFLPIVAATSGPAMKTLRAKVHQLKAAPDETAEFQACLEALGILEKTVTRTVTAPSSPSPSTAESPPEAALPDALAPWLRKYIGRVTSNSATASNPYRRTVTSFLNRVPETYVQLVQAALDDDGGSGSGSGRSTVYRLAVDIFAHWLVLELLLDGVWWIGETGAWELGRAVSFMRESECPGGDGGDVWWPGSMYAIRTELMKQVV